jgi:glutamate--cysteine ligase
MMKRTATVQANLDFADEDEAADKMRTALALSPLLTAMFASSPISEGKPNGYLSYRAAVWLDVDETRCGILPFAFKPGFGFRDYVEWALDVPMFFLVRDGRYHPVGGMPFRRFFVEGWNGETATIGDWETHLSTLFPEVRLKRYIEVRGADAAPLPVAAGLGAVWRGLLDDRSARQAAFALVADASVDERERLRREVPRAGLAARLSGRLLSDLAPEICRIARQGLAGLPGGVADQALLDPLAELAAAKRCPADDMLDAFNSAGGDAGKLVDAWEIEPA